MISFEIRNATLPVHKFIKIEANGTTIDLGLLTAIECADLANILEEAAENLRPAAK